MNDLEQPAFARVFRRMATTFRLKVKPSELDALEETYFELLKDAPFDDVLVAGQHCLSRGRTFPKPMEWLQALPHTTATPAENQRVMGVSECQEWHTAETAHWQWDPCDCLACQAAQVSHLPLRFVPEFTDLDTELRAFDVIRGRAVVVGHWAHGTELAAWYVARDHFFASAKALAALVVAAAPALVLSREPGMEG